MYTAIYCGAANFGGIVYCKFWGEGKKNGKKYAPVICFLLPMALHASQIAMQAVKINVYALFSCIFFQWHLGFFKTDYTPTRRGFDTFFGYYSAKEDYWDHSNDEMYGWGLDLHNDTEVILFIKN